MSTRAIRASIDAHLDRYLSLLMEEGRQDAVSALNSDALQPLTLENAVDFARIVVDLGLENYLHPLQPPPVVSGGAEGQDRKKKGSDLAQPVKMIFSSRHTPMCSLALTNVFSYSYSY